MKKYSVFKELNSDLFKIPHECFKKIVKKVYKLCKRYLRSVAREDVIADPWLFLDI